MLRIMLLLAICLSLFTNSAIAKGLDKNLNFTVICEDVFEEIGLGWFSKNPSPVKNNGKWGFINPDCTWAIPNEFEMAWSFFGDGFAAVKIGTGNGGWGAINRSGKFIVNPVYDDPPSFYLEHFGVHLKGEWMYLDRSGNLKDYYLAKKDMEEMEEIKNNEKELYTIGRTGHYPNYHIAKLNKNLYPLQIINDENFIEVGFESEGLIPAAIKNNNKVLWGYLNKNGKFQIEPQFDEAWNFHEGLASIGIGTIDNAKWGCINKSGKIEIFPKYEEGFNFTKRGYAAVKLNGHFGLITKNEQFLIKPVYNDWRWADEDGNLAFIKNGNLWSLVRLN